MKKDAPPRASQNVSQDSSQTASSSPIPIQITEKPVGKKDYRSFAAALFGTAAFKMLEWLAPNNIEALSDKMETARCLAKSSARSQESLSLDDTREQSIPAGVLPRDSPGGKIPTSKRANGHNGPFPGITTVVNTAEIHTNPPVEKPPDEAIIRSPKPRRRPNAKIRTSSGSRSSKVVVDAAEERLFGPPDAISKSNVRHSTQRSASQLRSEDSSDTGADSRSSTQVSQEDAADDHPTHIDGLPDLSTSGVDTGSISLRSEEPCNGSLEPASELDSYLPQSLARLNPEVVNFLCDVLQDDVTMERHMLEPAIISGSLRRSTSQRKVWKRKRRAHLPYSQNLKYEWKLFVEQSIFHVLSDPQALLESFTTHDGIVDSQTVWYCMLRLTRVAPHLVFDSLWIAMASLFVPPKSLQTSPPTAKVFATSQKPFSNAEAASLMSICFHALIAAAPLVTDSRQLFDMSRIRSRGLSLTGSGAAAEHRALLSLQYEDAFTDDLALRLARRLLMAVLTRRDFDELIELDLDLLDNAKQPNVLDMLLSQIEPSMQSAMRFSKSERSIHEKRVPIMLLDWARTVMIREWTGKPDVPGDGPFGGALMLIRAMCKPPIPRIVICTNLRPDRPETSGSSPR